MADLTGGIAETSGLLDTSRVKYREATAAHNRDAWLQEEGWRQIIEYLEKEAGVNLLQLQQFCQKADDADRRLASLVPAEKNRVLDYYSEPGQIELIRAIEADDLQELRGEIFRNGENGNPPFRPVRDQWEERRAEMIKLIEDQGGDFEVAEKTVWKGDDREPSIDLRKLPPEDRPWLPLPRKDGR